MASQEGLLAVVEVKIIQLQSMEDHGGIEVYFYFFFNIGNKCGWVVYTYSRPLDPRERYPVAFVP